MWKHEVVTSLLGNPKDKSHVLFEKNGGDVSILIKYQFQWHAKDVSYA